MAVSVDFRLLLTSGGISNGSLAKCLFDLAGKGPSDTSISVIPTASHIGPGDRSWLIEDLGRLKALGFQSIDVVDIAAIDKRYWLPRLEAADVLYFSGGQPLLPDGMFEPFRSGKPVTPAVGNASFCRGQWWKYGYCRHTWPEAVALSLRRRPTAHPGFGRPGVCRLFCGSSSG